MIVGQQEVYLSLVVSLLLIGGIRELVDHIIEHVALADPLEEGVPVGNTRVRGRVLSLREAGEGFVLERGNYLITRQQVETPCRPPRIGKVRIAGVEVVESLVTVGVGILLRGTLVGDDVEEVRARATEQESSPTEEG